MKFRVITKSGCGHCTQAQNLLAMKGYEFDLDIRTTDAELDAFIAEGYRTFPQIFHGDQHIGGFQELRVYIAGLDRDDF